ncbi:MAG: sulfatase-like hydrolase/transferase [Pseudomonadota bacterium]|nr:sulfatase-like hydrolase/transferase [Pseudomonadota bacterium]
MRNLLVIVSDEHRFDAMGCAGHDFVRTPNLDALADRSVRFTNAYTPSPICVPARAAFATGRYVHQTGHWDNASPYTGAPRGWGHQLQDAGIPVESIGKLHYRKPEDANGFDQLHIPMMVQDGIGMIWASIRHEDERLHAPGRMLGPEIGPGESTYSRYDAAVTDRTVDWLRDAAAGPQGWCLYVGLVAPHFPLVCPQPFYDIYDGMDLPEPKLHPSRGYQRHPWVEKQNAMMDTEMRFVDAEERRRAFVAYYGLISWLDHNVGRITTALEEAGLSDSTTVVYSSDHSDNVGARGLWGKSNMYQESVAVPLLVSDPDLAPGTCDTPVSLLDLSATIPAHFGIDPLPEMAGRSLVEIAGEEDDMERPVFSEYHAAGAVSGAFMLRRGRYKLIHYVGFEDELFDLEADPEETENLAGDPAHADLLADLHRELREICDPDEVNERAHAEQRQMVEALGGLEAVRDLGPKGATPPPQTGT